jgi:ribosomal protein S21
VNTTLLGGRDADHLARPTGAPEARRPETQARSSRKDTPPPDSTGRRCNALVVVQRGDVNYALKRLKKMLGNTGTNVAVKRAAQVPSERRRSKKVRARRRAQKLASRSKREEAMLPEYR